MTVSPETLDTALCEWCPNSTEATTKAIYSGCEDLISPRLCQRHGSELVSEFRNVNLYPLKNAPEYSILETEPYPMTGEWTVAQLELGARYGVPYPVCGDLTTRKGINK